MTLRMRAKKACTALWLCFDDAPMPREIFAPYHGGMACAGRRRRSQLRVAAGVRSCGLPLLLFL
jgi:hypothetical protein